MRGPGAELPPASTVVRRLRMSGCVAAEEEAEELLAAASDPATVEAWVRRRQQGEPLAWITGSTDFCGQAVAVDHGVYVPRRQSEELARRAARLLDASARRAAADLCTGAGAVAAHLTAAVPDATVVAVDIDPWAVDCARRNGVAVVRGDLGAPLRSASFGVVTAVAPYVPTGEMRLLPGDVQRFEPRRALDGGDDGLDVVRRVVTSAARLLRPGGWLLLEVGGAQDTDLARTLLTAGFDRPESWYDEDGDLRGLEVRLAADDDPR
ncbi:MAG: N5-glutamine methyltransferase family protein [Acidimicrobiales bacterium]